MPIPDLATLDRALKGQLRQALFVVVGAQLEPTIEVERREHDGPPTWDLLLVGRDAEGTVRHEVRITFPFPKRYEAAVLVIVKVYIRSHVQRIYQELAERYSADVFDVDDALCTIRFRSQRRGPLS